MSKFRILVIDDHELVVNGTTTALQQHYPEAEIYTARTAKQGLEQVTIVGTGSAWWENDFQPGLGFKKLMDHCKRVYLP